jgi:hypothetical protein
MNFQISPSVSVVHASLVGNVDVTSVLQIPGGVATGIDNRHQVAVFCGYDCWDSKEFGSALTLRENNLSECL